MLNSWCLVYRLWKNCVIVKVIKRINVIISTFKWKHFSVMTFCLSFCIIRGYYSDRHHNSSKFWKIVHVIKIGTWNKLSLIKTVSLDLVSFILYRMSFLRFIDRFQYRQNLILSHSGNSEYWINGWKTSRSTFERRQVIGQFTESTKPLFLFDQWTSPNVVICPWGDIDLIFVLLNRHLVIITIQNGKWVVIWRQ